MSATTHKVESLNDRAEELLQQSGEGFSRDALVWLHDAVVTAINLEFSTIPPYLCALWSIEDQGSTVAASVRHVVQEEMLHLSLACNLLVALDAGFEPPLAAPAFVPQYPTALAGGVHAGLEVRLGPLNRDMLRRFLTIELPHQRFVHECDDLWDAEQRDHVRAGHETIGTFYDKVKVVLQKLQPQFLIDRQLTGSLAWYNITTTDEACRVIELIKQQGEGSDASPAETADANLSINGLSHFFRFLEIYRGRRITFNGVAGEWDFGEVMPAVTCFPMAEIPAGGYPEPGEKLPDGVQTLLDNCDRNYTAMLQKLAAAWKTGDQGQLVHAIESMFSLQVDARALMQIKRPGSRQTYGPCFRFRP